MAGSAALVFLLVGAYILPWYSAWTLPVFGLVWYSRAAALAAGQAAFIGVAYAAPLLIGGAFSLYAAEVLPLVLPLALAYLAWSAWHGRLDVPVGADTPFAPARIATAGASTAPR